MLVSIDGGQTFQPLSEVRICYPGLATKEEGSTALHLTLTSEGIIQDVYSEEKELLATSSLMAQETAEQLIENDSACASMRCF